MRSSPAHIASIFPFVQQAVGIATILSNTGKLGVDVLKTIVNVADKAFIAYCKNRFPPECHIKLEKLNYQTSYAEHFKAIAIGIGRMIPVWGTLQSIYQCYQATKESGLIKPNKNMRKLWDEDAMYGDHRKLSKEDRQMLVDLLMD
jgi:hypothetical protein